MLDHLAPARRRLLVGLLGLLVLATFVGVGAVVLSRAGGGGEVADQAVPGPVLVVPGYGGDTASLDPLVAELRREGREAVVFSPTQGGTGDLRVQAKRLATLARQTMERTGAGSVDLVGYSAGGVVARLFVVDEGGRPVVRRVLTLGSPHHGTEVAALALEAAGACPTACEQLVPDSDLLRALDAGDETPSGPEWATVRTDDDRTVTPTDSAVLEGALNVRVQDECPDATTSHGRLPGDPVVLAMLPAALGEASPRPPEQVSC